MRGGICFSNMVGGGVIDVNNIIEQSAEFTLHNLHNVLCISHISFPYLSIYIYVYVYVCAHMISIITCINVVHMCLQLCSSWICIFS